MAYEIEDPKLEEEEVEQSEPPKGAPNGEDNKAEKGWLDSFAESYARASLYDPENTGGQVLPGDEDDPYYARDRREVELAKIRQEGITGLVYSAGRKLAYWMEGFTSSSEDNSDFDLEDTLNRDEVMPEDRVFFDGVSSEREYEYVKEGLETERSDLDLIDNAPWYIGFEKNVLEFALFPLAGKLTKGVGSAVKIAKGTTLTEGASSVLEQISSPTLREITKATGLGTILASADYAAKYEQTPEEALTNAAVFAAVGSAFPVTMYGLEKVSKLAKDILAPKSLKDAMEALEKETKKKGFGEKLTDTLTSKLYLTRTHPYMMLNSKLESVSKMAKKLFKFNESFVENLEDNAEARVSFANGRDAEDYARITKDLNDINKKAKEETGISSREWFSKAFYEGEEVLPEYLTGRGKIISACRSVKDKLAKLEELRGEVGETASFEISFLPKEEVGKGFSLDKIAKRVSEGDFGSKPVYLPRRYDRQAISENIDEFRNILKQGQINQYAIEQYNENGLTGEALLDKLQKYSSSKSLEKSVQKQIDHLLDYHESTNSSLEEVERRIVRVDDAALTKFFKTDALETSLNFLRKERPGLEFQKSIKEAGYENWWDFREKVQEEFNLQKKVEGLSQKDIDKLIKEQDLTMKLIDQAGLIAQHRYNELSHFSPQAEKAMSTAANWMYSCILGRTFLNSFSDMKGLAVRVGLGRMVRNLAGGLADSVRNAIRSLSGLEKTEQRKVLDSLVLGIEENHINTLIKLNPTQCDDLFYGSSYMDKSSKLLVKSTNFANFVNKASGMRYWDDLVRRVTGKVVLEDMAKGSKEIQDMIAKNEFSDEVLKKVYSEVNKIVNRPSFADVPDYAYNKFGRMIYSLQSWTFSNASNYLYPALRGGFLKKRIAESVFYVVSAQMIGKYIRNLAAGDPYDFSDEESLSRFEDDVMDATLDDIAGTLAIYWASGRTMWRRTRRTGVGGAVSSLSPLLSWTSSTVSGLSSIIGHMLGMYSNDLTPYQIRQALRLVPGNNLWYAEGVSRALSEGIADAIN